ncbi:MAG: aquaporin [Bacteroidota bacterium]
MKLNQLLAEAIGTYALVFCGTGAIVIDQVSGGTVGHSGIALTFGLVVMVMIYSVGEISGAHFNPAVSLGFAVAGVFAWKKVLPYCLAQLTGGLLASCSLLLLFPKAITLGETLPSGPPLQSFVLELILTFFLMFVIINVAKGSKEQGLMAGLAIGATVWLEAAFAGPISGASMNPVRSLAPAVANAQLQHLWIYLTAPCLGAVVAVIAWKAIKKND